MTAWVVSLVLAAAVWWAPSSGLCDAVLSLSGAWGLWRLWREGRMRGAWGAPGWLFAGLGAWLALSAAWSFWPAGTGRDLSKCIPLALAAAGMPGWLDADGRALRRALWASAAVVTVRLVLDFACLAATRGVPGVFVEGRYAEQFLWTHPNVASMAACLAAMAWLGLLPHARRGAARWGALAGAAACVGYLLALGSRGPQVVFALAVLAWPVAWLPGWRAKAVALAAAVALGWGAWAGSAALNPRFADAKTMSGANRRSDIWGHAWMIAKQRPATGWGYGKKAFTRLVYENPEQRPPSVPVRFPHAHSYWLMLYVQGGAVAFALGAAAWGALLAGLARATRRADPGPGVALGARLAARSVPVLLGMALLLLLGYGVADYPDSAVRAAMWLLGGMSVALGARTGVGR